MTIYQLQQDLRTNYNLEGKGFFLQKALFEFIQANAGLFNGDNFGTNIFINGRLDTIDQQLELENWQVLVITNSINEILERVTEIETKKEALKEAQKQREQMQNYYDSEFKLR